MPPPPALPSGTFVRGDVIAGRYRVLGVLATGGQGECYEVVHLFTDQVSVLKVLLTDLRDNAEFAARVQREAQRLGKLRHPNIVSVRDGGLTDGVPFFVMEKLNGCTLQEIFGGFGTLDPYSACSFGADISHALWAIHENELIHGDIKPDNLFAHFESDNVRAMILDLGITVASKGPDTPAKILALTPPFSSPEHFDGYVTPRSDLYCLGVVLYMGLTGAHPYSEGTSDEYYEAAHRSTALRPKPLAEMNPSLAIPNELQSLVTQLLEKDPARRPRDAFAVNSEFKALLKRIAAQARTAPALPGPLIRYITTLRQATNIPSGPKSISWKKSVQFIPFGPVTPGEVRDGIALGRKDTVETAWRGGATPSSDPRWASAPMLDGRGSNAAVAASSHIANAIVPEVEPRPALLSLVRTEPFALRRRQAAQDDSGEDVRPPSGRDLPAGARPKYADTDPSDPTFEWTEPEIAADPSTESSSARQVPSPAYGDTDPGDVPRFDDETSGDSEQDLLPSETAPERALSADVPSTPPAPLWLRFVFPVDFRWLTSDEPEPSEVTEAPKVAEAHPPPRDGAMHPSPPPPAASTPKPVVRTSPPGEGPMRRRRPTSTAVLAAIVVILAGMSLGLWYRSRVDRPRSPSSSTTPASQAPLGGQGAR